MKSIEFFVVVAKMRQAQKKYFTLPFAHPDKGKWLNESKRLEGIIDREIQRVTPLKDVTELAVAWAPYDLNCSTQLKLAI